MYIQREAEALIGKSLGKRIVAVVGPRQAGKTTMVRHWLERCGKKFVELSFDDPEVLSMFDSNIKTFEKIFVEPNEIVFIDEFQISENGGKKLKYLYDKHPGKGIIISGSSSLSLLLKSVTPLVGRLKVIELYPLSFREYLSHAKPELLRDWSPEVGEMARPYLEEFIEFGGYPAVVLEKDREEKKDILKTIVRLLVARDFAMWNEMRSVADIQKLLKAVALSMGQASVESLSRMVGRSVTWIKDKLSFLESLYLIRSIPPFHTNRKTELTKRRKFMFLDTGLASLYGAGRGMLFENYVFSELVKYGHSVFYWRTRAGAEVDFVVEKNGKPIPIEVKAGKYEMTRAMRSFLERYRPEKFFVACFSGTGDGFLPIDRIWGMDA